MPPFEDRKPLLSAKNTLQEIPSMCAFRNCTVVQIVLCLSVLCRAEGQGGPTGSGYRAVSEDVSDISFYRGAESTDPYGQDDSSNGGGRRARNVILLIGDGMGVAQAQLARLKAVGAEGKLYMEKLPVSGFMKTHSADAHVTDSAAAGTAIACGIKTNNHMVGVAPDGTAYQSLLEVAQNKGQWTGLVATSTITHATPAAFASHVPSRQDERRIAAQILEQKINVVFGGGKKHWLPEGPDSTRDLVNEAREGGYAVVETAGAMRGTEEEHVLGLFNDGPLTTVSPEPSLPGMTRKAIALLSRNERGFFLMVEGSQIDWACHANDAGNCIKQTLLFDLAVREAVEFAREDGETLVVVTADHECGGLAVLGGDVAKREPRAQWGTTGHSAAPVPIYAFGPGAGVFCGVMDNTELSARIAGRMGIETWPRPRR
jgi:alkaline phosphatase